MPARNKEIDNWIEKEQHKHYCKCGCGSEILIQRRYFWIGIPKFISGHNIRIRNPMDNYTARKKISEVTKGEKNPMYGKSPSKKTREKIAKSMKGEKNHFYGKKHTEKSRKKMSKSHKGIQAQEKHPMWGKKGKDNPLFGKSLSEEHREKVANALKGKPKTVEHRKKLSEAIKGEKSPMYGKHLPEETKRKMGESRKGEKHWNYGKRGEETPNWRGGLSFEPYCPKFNDAFKEAIREKFNRICFLCPTTEEENGRRLSIHHVNYNKDCLCDNSECEFVPLCEVCHGKTSHNRTYWENTIIAKLGVWGGSK